MFQAEGIAIYQSTQEKWFKGNQERGIEKVNPAFGLDEVKERREATDFESRLHIYQLVKDLNFTFMSDLLWETPVLIHFTLVPLKENRNQFLFT